MGSPYQIDNEGIGSGPFLTVSIREEDNHFTQDEMDAEHTACVFTGNNEVGKGKLGDCVAGKMVWVSTDVITGTKRPTTGAVQMRGVARFKYSNPAPQVDSHVQLDGNGKVRLAEDGKGNGNVIAVDTVETTCDVWLG